MSMSTDVLSIRKDAFAEAKIKVTGLNVLHDGDYEYFHVMGMAEATPGGPAGLDMTGDIWVIGAVAKNAEGKVIGMGDQAVSLHYSPVAAFEISIWPKAGGISSVSEVEVYPFVKQMMD